MGEVTNYRLKCLKAASEGGGAPEEEGREGGRGTKLEVLESLALHSH